MTQHKQGRIAQFLENTALDWLPIIFNEAAFPKSERPTSARKDEIIAQIIDLQGEPLAELVTNYRKLLEQEEQRRIQIETKATYLLGFIAVALSFIIGFAQFLLGEGILAQPLRWIAVVLYVLIASSLLVTIMLAHRSVVISTFHKPMPADLLKLRKSNVNHFYRGLVADLLFCYENNQAVVNDKITYVIGAQSWFRNTLILLLILLITIAAGIVTTPARNAPNESQPIQMIILTPTPTESPTPTPTATMTFTPTPSATHTPLPPPVATVPATRTP